MKKGLLYGILLCITILAGCSDEKEFQDSNIKGNYTLKARIENGEARTAINEKNEVVWVATDQIGVYGDKGTDNTPFTYDSMTEDKVSATFKGNLEREENAAVVYYPYSKDAILDGEKMIFTLPAEYNYTENSNAPMMGIKQDDGSFVFKHLCGLMKVTISGVPAGSSHLTINSVGDDAPGIAGLTNVNDIHATDAILAMDASTGKSITVNVSTKEVTDKTFYIPLPVGTYPQLSVSFENGDSVYFTKDIMDCGIKRATIINMPVVAISPNEKIKDYIENSLGKDFDVFLAELKELLESETTIKEYTLNDSGAEIIYQDGTTNVLIFRMRGDESIEEQEYIFSPEARNARTISDFTYQIAAIKGESILNNTSVLRWAPFDGHGYSGIPEWGAGTKNSYKETWTMLKEESPINFDLDSYNYYDNGISATFDNLLINMPNAGLTIIDTHGIEGKYITIPQDKRWTGAILGEEVTARNQFVSLFSCIIDIDIITSTVKDIYPIIGMHADYLEEKISSNKLPNSIIYNGSCQSQQGSNLRKTFFDLGASTYIGFTESIVDGFNCQYKHAFLKDLCIGIQTTKDPYQSVDELSYTLIGDNNLSGYINKRNYAFVRSGEWTYGSFEISNNFNGYLFCRFASISTNSVEDSQINNYSANITGKINGYNNLKNGYNNSENESVLYKIYYSTKEFTKTTDADIKTLDITDLLSGSDGTVSATLVNLESNKDYWFTIGFEYDDKYYYGEIKTFKTASITSDGKAIDLGLNVKWASYNVGATAPAEQGTKYACWDMLRNLSYEERNALELTDYTGYEIGKTKYDVARNQWGGNWRMPTYNELNELKEKCKWEFSKEGNVYGMKVTGTNGNSIFLPGTVTQQIMDIVSFDGSYWSSTWLNDLGGPIGLSFVATGGSSYISPTFTVNVEGGAESGASFIRPVCDK